MSEKWSHETILSLLNLTHTLANRTRRNYCLTKNMQVVPESKVLMKHGHSAILETCTPKKLRAD
jgi:hypothetical protein